MTAPGNEMAAGSAGGDRLLVYREQVIRTVKAALAQGRLTEDECEERVVQASASRSHAELTALTADLPVGQIESPARTPRARDVWIGVSVSIAAASVVAAVRFGHPDVPLAILAFLVAAVTLLVAPIVTVGVMVDVRRQRRSGGQLPSWPAPGLSGSPPRRLASAASAESIQSTDRGQQHDVEEPRSNLARQQSPGRGRRYRYTSTPDPYLA